MDKISALDAARVELQVQFDQTIQALAGLPCFPQAYTPAALEKKRTKLIEDLKHIRLALNVVVARRNNLVRQLATPANRDTLIFPIQSISKADQGLVNH